MPLLATDASAADGAIRGGLEGSERLITVVFVDLRSSTGLSEHRLPYDVLFILNQFFHEMTAALVATGGHYSQFTGDGLMALYGLHAGNPAAGVAEALRGAREMLSRLEQLNYRLRGDLPAPLRIGIGIHYGEAIVGSMGPPRSQIITAIGDTVNTCARLEGLTKEYDCAVVVSRAAAEAAGLALDMEKRHEMPVKGRTQPVQFYALQGTQDLPPKASLTGVPAGSPSPRGRSNCRAGSATGAAVAPPRRAPPSEIASEPGANSPPSTPPRRPAA